MFQGQQMPLGQPRQQGQHKTLQLAASKNGDKPLCKECNRPHSGKCMHGSFRCFFCKEGHKAGDCPKKNQAVTGRAYVMHAEEAEPD